MKNLSRLGLTCSATPVRPPARLSYFAPFARRRRRLLRQPLVRACARFSLCARHVLHRAGCSGVGAPPPRGNGSLPRLYRSGLAAAPLGCIFLAPRRVTAARADEKLHNCLGGVCPVIDEECVCLRKIDTGRVVIFIAWYRMKV